MAAVQATEQFFNEVVSQNSQPGLIDFRALWCRPCRAMSSVVEELADEVAGHAFAVRAEVDELPRDSAGYGIQAIPAFFVAKDGKIQERMSGVVSKQELKEALEPFMSSRLKVCDSCGVD